MSELALGPGDVLPVAFALTAAYEHGLLSAIGGEPLTREQLAGALGLDLRALGLLLDVLLAFGLIERQGERFRLSSLLSSAAALAPGGLSYDQKLWKGLSTFLIDGAPLTGIDRGAEGRACLYAGVVSELGRLWADAAHRLELALVGHGPRVLDIGCGSGVWSLGLAGARHDVLVTGVDFEPVLPSFLERARSLGVEQQVHTRAGDVHAMSLEPQAFDVVLIANVLRLETPERAKALVSRLAESVVRGGQVVVVDALAQGSERAERGRAIYALHLGLRSKAGGVHAPETVARWLTDAGLERVEAIDLGLPIGALSALRAWKSETVS